MPETTEASTALLSKPEQTKTLVAEGLPGRVETLDRRGVVRKIGEQADRLLKERARDTKTIKSLTAYAAEEGMAARLPTEQVTHQRSTEAYLALLDKQSDTSFAIEASPGYAKDERFITLRFQTLGENKGSLGGGVILLTYKDGQQEPIDIQTEKVDNVHLLQFSDEMWFNGDPAIYSGVVFSKEHTELSDADVAKLFGRLASEEIETDPTLTESAARHSEINHRLGHARSMLDIARQKGNREEITQAEQAFLAVRSEWETLWQMLQRIAMQAQPKAEAGEKSEQEEEETKGLENTQKELEKISQQEDA